MQSTFNLHVVNTETDELHHIRLFHNFNTWKFERHSAISSDRASRHLVTIHRRLKYVHCVRIEHLTFAFSLLSPYTQITCACTAIKSSRRHGSEPAGKICHWQRETTASQVVVQYDAMLYGLCNQSWMRHSTRSRIHTNLAVSDITSCDTEEMVDGETENQLSWQQPKQSTNKTRESTIVRVEFNRQNLSEQFKLFDSSNSATAKKKWKMWNRIVESEQKERTKNLWINYDELLYGLGRLILSNSTNVDSKFQREKF